MNDMQICCIKISLPTSCTVFLQLLYQAATCFGHLSCPSLGSYKFGPHVQCIWQPVTDIRIIYQLDATEYLFTLARHVSGLYAHLQEQWML